MKVLHVSVTIKMMTVQWNKNRFIRGPLNQIQPPSDLIMTFN
jgi:hypothetical protein